MAEQNSLDKFRSKEVEERFQELISGIVNEEFENMNTALDPQPVGCSKDGTECRIRFIKKDWERNQRMQVHGGAVSGMMDTAMGMSIMAKSGRPVTTAELNVSFIRPFLGESFLIDTWEEISSEQDPLLMMKNQESFLLQRRQILLM